MKIEIKKVSSTEENVSQREISYDIYIDGEYKTTFKDICDALDYKEEIENNSTK